MAQTLDAKTLARRGEHSACSHASAPFGVLPGLGAATATYCWFKPLSNFDRDMAVAQKHRKNGTLVNGTKDYHLRNPSSLILSHTHILLKSIGHALVQKDKLGNPANIGGYMGVLLCSMLAFTAILGSSC